MNLTTRNRHLTPTRRKSSRRTWLCWWLQHRRRKRTTPAINAPVITSTAWAWGQTEAGWVDVYLEFTFDHGALPVATFELWEGEGTSADHLLATLSSGQVSFWHNHATQDIVEFHYKLRYVNGPVVGPFSNEIVVSPYPAPNAPTDLQADNEGAGLVSLTWSMVGVDYEDGSLVEGRKDADPFVQMLANDPDQEEVEVSVPSSGSWEFRVRAYNGVGFSDYSNVAQVEVT